MSAGWKANTGQKIERLYAWVATEPDGGEGVCSMLTADNMHIPLIGADRERIESLRSVAVLISHATGYKVQLKVFGSGVVIDEV